MPQTKEIVWVRQLARLGVAGAVPAAVDAPVIMQRRSCDCEGASDSVYRRGSVDIPVRNRDGRAFSGIWRR